MGQNNILTGYPSIDKPWLKYYSEESINAPLPECTVYEYMYQNNKDYPEQIAIDYFGRKITFAELFESIDKVATAFREIGVKEGDVVTIVSVSCVTSILCFYALNKIGAVSDYISVLSTEEEIGRYLVDSNSRYVVSLDLFAEKVLKVATKNHIDRVVVYSLKEWMPTSIGIGYLLKTRKFDKSFLKDKSVLTWNDFLKSADGKKMEAYSKDPNTVCTHGHTGGTTGFPKTVLLNDLSVNAIAHQYYLTFERERGDTFMNILIPFVIYGLVSCMHMPLSLGLRIVVVPKFDDTNWAGYIKKYKPKFIGAIPSFVIPMLKDPKLDTVDMSCLKFIAVGGDGMTESLEKEVNKFFRQHNANIELTKGYGMTEVCASAVTGMTGVNKLGSVGIPMVKNNAKIVNVDSKEECKFGEIGELCLRCSAMMLGYKDDVEATSELIHIHSDNKKWVHTGDLAYIDEDGFIFLVGRIKRIILVGTSEMGYKVFPSIIEEKIMSIGDIFQTCVIGAMKGNDKVLRACIVLKKTAVGNETEIEGKLREIFDRDMSEFHRPAYYEFVVELPLTPAGKVDYRKLESIFEV